MSLNTRLGNLENILDDKLTKQKSYLLESPVLTNAQFKKVCDTFKDETNIIDLTYVIHDKNTLKNQLDRIRVEAEECVRCGAKHLVISD
jgi:glutamate synthase (NADPH/NADH) large chain